MDGFDPTAFFGADFLVPGVMLFHCSRAMVSPNSYEFFIDFIRIVRAGTHKCKERRGGGSAGRAVRRVLSPLTGGSLASIKTLDQLPHPFPEEIVGDITNDTPHFLSVFNDDEGGRVDNAFNER